MALIDMDFANGGGGGDITQIVMFNTLSTQYTTLHTDSFSSPADIVIMTYDSAGTDGSKILKPGDSVTIQTTGAWATTVVFSFASDGQSVSWTKSTGYGNVIYFAVS